MSAPSSFRLISPFINNNEGYMEKIVIGIDFSKETFDATLLRVEDGDLSACGCGLHEKFSNNRPGWRKCLSWARRKTERKPSADWLFCGEHTGRHSVGMCDFLHSQGLVMWHESPLRIKRSLGIVRGKSDKADSLRIAQYAFRNKDKAVRYEPLGETEAKLRELFLTRHKIVEQRKALMTRSASMCDYSRGTDAERFAIRQTEAVVKAMDKAIEELERKMKEVIASDPEVRETYECITSIKGVALENGVAFIVYTNNFRDFGADPRRIATYWGVAVFAQDSGTSVHKKARTSPMASKKLKALLTQAALSAIIHEPRIKEYYGSLIKRGKDKNVARNNVKNKLIHIITALAVSKTKYDPMHEAYGKAA